MEALKGVFQKVVDKVIDEKAEGIFANAIEKGLKDIADDMFSSYGSEFKKGLQKRLEEGLDVSFENLDLQTYSAFITQALQEKVDANIYKNAFEGIDETLKAITGTLKPEYKLSELVESFKESVDSYDKEDHNECFFSSEKNYERGWTTVCLDHDPDSSEDNAEVEFMISDEGSVFILRTKTTWSKKMDKNDPIKASSFTNFQMLLFKIKNARNVKVKIDDNNVDTSYNHEGY